MEDVREVQSSRGALLFDLEEANCHVVERVP